MRIDASSLIAAQSAQRPTQPAPRPVQSADNSLFEPLIFPEAKAEAAPSKPRTPGAQTPPRRPGALIDITV